MTSLRVLVSAYACEPGKGSEPGVGWNFARGMAARHQVWVLTRANNRLPIEAELARNPVGGLRFVYVELPASLRWWKRGSRGIQLYYYLWQVWAYFLARRLHRKVRFDLVHHVTFAKYWTPSLMALLPVPFVWGPVGGGESAPRAFWKDFSPRGRRYEHLREAARWMAELDPLVRLTARRARLAFASTEETAKRIRELGASEVVTMSQIGLNSAEIDKLEKYESVPHDLAPVRFVSIGNLLHLKGFHLGLRAFAASGLSDAEYWVIGDGPERARLEQLALELGIVGSVTFFGRLSRDETLEKLGASTVLVHPSLHDSGGWVCIEAMAAAKPVIYLDIGGPAAQVAGVAGIEVAARNPHHSVQALAVAMRRLAEDRDLVRSLGAGGRRRVRKEYDWRHKIEVMAGYYNQVKGLPIGEGPSRTRASSTTQERN